jgi:hypothetical protein
VNLEKYRLYFYSIFNNRGMLLTQTGGSPIKEMVEPSMKSALDLGGGAQYVGRV